MHPNFSMKSISLVSDRNNLRKLFDFTCNHLGGSFRIDVDIIFNTMFFTRWEESTIRLISGFQNFGYGHEFEKAFTIFDQDLTNSSSHHRIVKYNLGGMNCLVRFEADAYFDDCPSSSSHSPSSKSPAENPASTENDLSTALESLTLQSSEKDTEHVAKKGIRVLQSGRLVSPASVIEVKSRSKMIKLQDIIPQLWFSQTEHLFVGYHQQGVIEQEVTRYEMAAHFKAWETEHEEQLQKLVSLILRIREAAQGAKDGKCVIVYDHVEESRKMRIYETDRKGLIGFLDGEKKCWDKS
jgi:hypothetical protein